MLLTHRRPPGPKSLLFRPLYGPGERNAADTLLQLAREFGDVVFFRLPPLRSIYLLSHPDDIKDVLVAHDRDFTKSRGLQRARRLLGNGLLTSEGELHRRQRRLVQPVLTRERIAENSAAAMIVFAQRASSQFRDGETVDAAEAMRRLTLAIAGKTLFGADIEAEAGEITGALATILELFPASLQPFSEIFDHLPVPQTLRFRRARTRLDTVIYALIARRRADRGAGDDVLALLLRARDVDGVAMNDEQIRDEVMTLLLAGHETTANALAWTWYLLAQHPEVEAMLHAEVDSVVGGRTPTPDALGRLEYTAAVLSESMRLYPPAWAIGRRALRAYHAGEYTVPRGAVILVSPYVVHRDGRWWPQPLRFEPDRWLRPGAARPPFAYFPFGGGSRVCIGEWFARTETALVLATLAQDWRMRLVPDQRIEIQPLVTLRPKYGIRMTLGRRAL